MENIFLKQLATKQINAADQLDINAPYSFIEWRQHRPTYTEEDVVYHYNQYVVDWFNKNKNKPISQKFLLRQKYLYLLSQLQLFFSEEEKNEWYNKVNVADEKELLLAIPYFAKKLKAISLYYLKLRKKLKNVKLKYNLVGTEFGLEQEIQNRLMEVFSDLNTELPPEIANNLPTLETLRDNLTVNVEQLYDDSVYFDRDPTVALSAYYDPFHELTAEFFATKGLSLSSDDWIFNSFSVPVTSNLDGFVAQLTGNIFEVSDVDLYGSFIQKFLGENKYLTNFNSASSVTSVYSITIEPGSNNFFYPYGTPTPALTGRQIPPVALSSVVLEGATASDTISGSDTIEVRIGDQTKIAWLQNIEYTEDVKTLEANFREAKTSFIFPFPGYGLSAEDINWTGPSLSSTPEYNFLTKIFKSAVNQAYWSQAVPLDSTRPIFINNTNLIADGAFANTTPALADKIYIKKRKDGQQSSLSAVEAAWLYKPQRTAIPITTTTATSALFWPGAYIGPDVLTLPEHLKEQSFDDSIAPIRVNDLYVPFAVASNSFETAEKIYKIQRPNDLLLSAIECCWLYSPSISSDNYVWNAQGGFSLVVPPGEVIKFIWTGPDNTPIGDAFGFIEHSSYCPFATSEETDPSKCVCRQVYYSPFGHNGDRFTDFNSNADYIAVDTANNLDPFVLGTWRDTLSGTFESSSEFVWYKTTKKREWGNGEWKTTNGQEPFLLQRGKSYFYKRSITLAYNKQPSYVVSYQYPDNNTIWLEAKRSSNGTWISTERESLMTLNAGDLLKWDKKQYTSFKLISSALVENVSENKGNIWSGLDVIPLSGNFADSTTIIWPAFPHPLWGKPDSQYPSWENPYSQYPLLSGYPITLADISQIYWWKITRQPTIDQYKRLTNHAWTEYDVVPFGMPVTLTWATTSAEVAVLDSQYPLDLNTGVPITSADIDQIYWWKLTVDYKDNELSYPYYIYENTFIPRLPGTYYIEVSARRTTGEDIHFTEIPSIYVAPLVSEYLYDSNFATFTPYLTGTYSVEVSAHVRFQQRDIPTLSESRELLDRIIEEQDYHFTNIPLLSVIPPYRQESVGINQQQPVGGYIILQPLSGWNYTTNTYDLTSGGGKPYWAVLDPQTTVGPTYIDDYLPNTLPTISPISFNYGDVVEYQRKGERFTWKQPLDYKTFNQTTQWTLITSASGQSPVSDIILSNIVDGKPVEIIYDAKSTFVWQVSVETPVRSTFAIANATSTFQTDLLFDTSTFQTDLLFDAVASSTVLSNRFYPTIATVPIAEKLYTEEESGGFFTQDKLGASQYINNNFTAELTGEYFESSFLTEDSSKHIGGRGLTQKDQNTLYTWTENNGWIKEPQTSNELAGSVKKSLTKTLQTFVPYQNNSELKEFGLITPTSRVSPWGGKEEDEWTDLLNEPKSFTGVRNVSAWGESQILKQNQKTMDIWITDIFGNQYGLFKSIADDEKSIYNRSNVPGQLWVKTNEQIVTPAYTSLSSVFEPFKTISPSVYNQLIGEGIINVDSFFDTLMFETSSAVVYSKITYNYDSGNIESLLDNTRFKYLTKTDLVDISFGQTWFFETEKKVHNLYVSVSAEKLFPEIFELDLITNSFGKKFPFNEEEQTSLNQALSGLSVKSIDRPLLTHNKTLKQSLITIIGTQTNNEAFVVEIVTDDREDQRTNSITIYTDTKHRPIPFSTQVSVLSNYFYETIPVAFTPTDTIQIYNRDYTVVSISAINDPTYYELVNFTSNVTAYNDGTFVAYFENPGVYHVNYKVGNDAGFNLGCLTLSAMSREDVVLLNGEAGFLVIDGYNGRYII